MADVTIDSSISTATARGQRSLVFTSKDVGYSFYINADGTFVYAKTTDGGATWGSAIVVAAATTHVAFDVWYDRWTKGDDGNFIHIWYFDTTNDDVFYRTLDVQGSPTDAFGVQRTIFNGATSVAGLGTFVSGTKARASQGSPVTRSNLYCAFDIDAGAEFGFYRSTDGGVTWGSRDATLVEATLDWAMLFPANADDPNDIWALYYDASATAMTVKTHDDSAGTTSESATIETVIGIAADLTGQLPFSAAIRNSDGHLIIGLVNDRDTATADFRVFDWDGSTATAKTNITTNIDDIYYPSVFIDQNTDDIYVAYNGEKSGADALGVTSNINYTKSTDDGVTWSSGDTVYQEAGAGAPLQTWAPLMGDRFYVSWRRGTLLEGNKVNSLDLSSAGGIAATLSQTLANAALTSAATLAIAADASNTLALSSSADAALAIKANLAVTLDALTLSATGGAAVLIADLDQTLGAVTLSADATLAIKADESSTLDAATLAAAGALAISADLSQTLGASTISATGALGITANLAQTLGDVTAASAAGVGIAAALAVTLDAVSIASDARLGIAASLSQTLDALTLSATAGSPQSTADFSQTLAALGLSSVGTVLITADASSALADLSLSADATVSQPAAVVTTTTTNPIRGIPRRKVRAFIGTPDKPQRVEPKKPKRPALMADVAVELAPLELVATMGEPPALRTRRRAKTIARMPMH